MLTCKEKSDILDLAFAITTIVFKAIQRPIEEHSVTAVALEVADVLVSANVKSVDDLKELMAEAAMEATMQAATMPQPKYDM